MGKNERLACQLKYGVLGYETCLIAYEKICKLGGQEMEFVQIPLNKVIHDAKGEMPIYVKALTGK